MSLIYTIQMFIMNSLLSLAKLLGRYPKFPGPTFTKTYPCRPHLTHRVFIPNSHKDGEKHPLYLDIHGGGFTLGLPELDDEFCHYFANTFNVVVVSLQYGLAPAYKFPTQVYDVAEVAAAVIADSSLPIDTAKVAMGGFSAGGNLTLAASQVEPLKGRVNAAIPIYPVLDFVPKVEEKLASRWSPNHPDMLSRISRVFNWAYQSKGIDHKNPLLSPRYAKRGDLPPWLYLISCEFDMLGVEGMIVAEEFAGRTPTPVGTFPNEISWEADEARVKWEMIRGQEHGFNQMRQKDKEKEAQRVSDSMDMYGRMGEWLFRGPFSS